MGLSAASSASEVDLDPDREDSWEDWDSEFLEGLGRIRGGQQVR
jgi:hypothetical protein